MANYRTENPATGEVLRTWDTLDDSAVDAAVERGHDARRGWSDTPLAERAALLARVADRYAERTDELADIIATEMGKPHAQGVGEIGLVVSIYRYYAERATELLAPEPLPAQGSQSSIVLKEPVGLLLGVMPWNFPYYQVARFAAPNLLAGNTILLKHASICAHSSQLMEEIFTECGLPAGVYQNVFVDSDQISTIIADPRVRGVSLTGSERAGQAVAETAGKHLKKSVLELGGSDAMIVLGGDIRATAKTAARARLSNAGQACNSPKRMIVLDRHYDEFVDELTRAVAAQVVGDPHDPNTQVGPLSSQEGLDTLLEQVQDAVDKGATVHTGGDKASSEGAYMQPTVLTGITDRMRAYTEELFGPVAMVFPVSDVDEAVEFANSSDFGLSGSVWTDDLDLAETTARRLDVGMAYVNEHGTSLAGLPFGGVKRSGFGRELAQYGIDEFINRKLVRVALS
ncbi:succinate-semialdehyde dehydrogenase / glutarate-semialdehyde dehydrogenase [Austwickia chelonae]|uniref:Putative aldehyde dehydrogenase n=1 Tax=Austwickia chelonae NBRC 105200 TaxID=1184607 RepID=K6WAR5_9MICO|nr:NAD-dependent succinate-semialdehyde dehydrogenase [Austwickia chelonae]GAB78942.1 putative aldehyde dehydrogenase [Austwickia chelonae NBRC 105200]SEV86993.1 succinate-semialdehyde dehydrogenase / glutarate-semialdehyde dehydrogenase [Austwickia chelonae]